LWFFGIFDTFLTLSFNFESKFQKDFYFWEENKSKNIFLF
jgi:hypothetical protein